MRTILGGYTADDYRSCSESWECSLEKAKSNLDKRLAEERLLLGMVLQSFSEEIPDANVTGSAKQLISDAAAAYTEMTAWFAEQRPLILTVFWEPDDFALQVQQKISLACTRNELLVSNATLVIINI